jgi:hypothetical protein
MRTRTEALLTPRDALPIRGDALPIPEDALRVPEDALRVRRASPGRLGDALCTERFVDVASVKGLVKDRR